MFTSSDIAKLTDGELQTLMREAEEVQLRVLQQVRQLEEQRQVTIARGDADDLTPVGNPASPLPLSPDSVISLTTSGGAIPTVRCAPGYEGICAHGVWPSGGLSWEMKSPALAR